MQDWWNSSEEATRRAERPQANDWFRFMQRPHEYFDYRSAKKRCALCPQLSQGHRVLEHPDSQPTCQAASFVVHLS